MAILYNAYCVQNQRAVNMDSLLLKERPLNGQSACLAVVCDGVGSTRDGAYASSAAAQMMWTWFDSIDCSERLGLQLCNCVLEINRYVAQAAQQKALQTASTLSALLIWKERYYIANVGDSRVYCLDRGRLFQLTEDQTSNGKLTSWIGRANHIDVFYNEGICRKKRFLVCSDGLYKRMEMPYLQNALIGASKKNLEKIGEQLARHVIDLGETDNISAAIVLCES